MDQNMEIENGDETIRIDFETRRVVIHERYEKLHILNDLLLAVWFLAGSIMFFYQHWTYWGTWLFVLGSAQMGIGPCIRIMHKLHIKRFEKDWTQRIEDALKMNSNGVERRTSTEDRTDGSATGPGDSTREMW